MTDLVRVPISPETRAKILQVEPRATRDMTERGGETYLAISLESFNRLCSVQARGESMGDVILSAVQNGVMEWSK